MNLKDFIPPVFVNLRRRLRLKMPTYRTYQDALAQCRTGYDAQELAHVVVEKTARYRDTLRSDRVVITDLRGASVATAIGLSAVGRRLNCIDFGGAAGTHFFLAQSLFGASIEFRWNIVETMSLVAAAKKMSGDGLQFFTSIDEAAQAFTAANEKIDLVFTSGALGYLPKPEETLAHLIELGANRIFITRVGLSDQKLDRRVTVQCSSLRSNGPGPLPPGVKDREVQYPVTFCFKDEIEAILRTRYAIDIAFLEERNAYSIGPKPISMYGFFGRLKNSRLR